MRPWPTTGELTSNHSDAKKGHVLRKAQLLCAWSMQQLSAQCQAFLPRRAKEARRGRDRGCQPRQVMKAENNRQRRRGPQRKALFRAHPACPATSACTTKRIGPIRSPSSHALRTALVSGRLGISICGPSDELTDLRSRWGGSSVDVCHNMQPAFHSTHEARSVSRSRQ